MFIFNEVRWALLWPISLNIKTCVGRTRGIDTAEKLQEVARHFHAS